MVVALIIVGVVFLGIYLYGENTSLQITKHIIVNDKIPDGFVGYKIVHISDFHNTKSEKLTNSLIKGVQKLNPNVIVITGDTIDSRRTRIDIAFNFVNQLVKIADVYYIPGNHESRIKEYEALKKSLLSIGVNILENDTVILKENGDSINLLGIKDPAFYYEYLVEDKEIVKKELEELEYNKDVYTILLSHRPEVFDTYVEQDIDLVFTGHAHGGQIRLPLIGGLIAPVQGFLPKFTEGIHKKNNTTMLISRGIGNSLFPFRINNRPELLIVELKNK